MNFSDIKIGMKDSISKTITETDVILFAGVTLDTNSAHTNEVKAKESVLKQE